MLMTFLFFVFEELPACYTRSMLNNVLYILLFIDFLFYGGGSSF